MSRVKALFEDEIEGGHDRFVGGEITEDEFRTLLKRWFNCSYVVEGFVDAAKDFKAEGEAYIAGLPKASLQPVAK